MRKFEETSPDALHGAIRKSPLAALVAFDGTELIAVHVPLLLDLTAGGQGVLRGHIARANPLMKLDGAPLLAIFQAAEAYVTPAWYHAKSEDGRVVPTWNYMVVHARGSLRLRDDPAYTLEMVAALTRQSEAGRDRPWQVSDAPRDYIEKMLKAIVGIEIPVARLDGTRKASQNRDARDRAAVKAGLAADERAAGREMADWMSEA